MPRAALLGLRSAVFRERSRVAHTAPKPTMLDSGGLAWVALCALTTTTVGVKGL